MKGKGLFLTISHLLYDAALVDGFVSIEEIREFLEESKADVVATLQVLHNVMVAVTQEEYMNVLGQIMTRLGKQRSEIIRWKNRYHRASRADSYYTLNPIVSSLIEKGRGSTPIYEALRVVVSELLEQWENAATSEKLGEFTSRLSKDHKEGMVTEISRRFVLVETCELNEDDKEKLMQSPMTVERFKRLCAPKFLKAYEMGRELKVNITPSDVISYVSQQLRKEELVR